MYNLLDQWIAFENSFRIVCKCLTKYKNTQNVRYTCIVKIWCQYITKTGYITVLSQTGEGKEKKFFKYNSEKWKGRMQGISNIHINCFDFYA